ncbi:universal stress protein [Sphingomonas oryzagri]|jgi:nucleotide-binding universal stress UspA family protein|uniref:Universal stress protein n=1 Tax=Sphingomonas oryzagri TaxID=3042314 RepID=A0ABT6N6W1_9SPHN|nr:universal stress protein [Sphingomonas oryzagri]MDH7640825.1 universal stress protein [Sphingomonas oryzagri]
MDDAILPRTYLVVLDGSAEARTALRFAARRAAKTQGRVEMLAVVEPAEFVQWGGVQDALEEEARLGAEALLHQAAGEIVEELGVKPEITIRQGDPVKAVRALLEERPNTAALVLGAQASGGPGPLVAYFAGAEAGLMPCPVMIIPGSLGDEALDRLS